MLNLSFWILTNIFSNSHPSYVLAVLYCIEKFMSKELKNELQPNYKPFLYWYLNGPNTYVIG